MLGIDLQEGAGIVRSWAGRYGLTFPLLLDTNLSVWGQYGMGYIPHNVVIDTNMVVRYTNYGYNETAIISTIEAWLPSSVEDETGPEGLPTAFRLDQNYPNPFNAKTVIRYQLPKTVEVSVRIFNLLGEEIKTIVNEVKEAGYFESRWNGKDNSGKEVASGIYIYRIKAGNFTDVKKMTLLR